MSQASSTVVRIRRYAPSDHYTILQNSFLRDGSYTLRARGMLSALLSLADGWETNRTRIDALAPELGKDGMDTVLRELKQRGHMHTERINAGGGRFLWIWHISADPVSDWAAMFTAAKKPSPAQPSPDNPPMARAAETSKSDKFSQVAPSPAQPSVAEPGVIEEVTQEQNQPSYLASEDTPAAPRSTSRGRREDQPSDPEDQKRYAAATRVLAAVMAEVPVHLRPNGLKANLLIGRAARLLSLGRTPEDLLAQLRADGSLESAVSVYAVMDARLKAAAAAPIFKPSGKSGGKGTPAPRPVWCRECVESTRRLVVGEDCRDAGRCPRCHPQSVAERAAV